MTTPEQEGFYWYRHPDCFLTIVQTELRPDNGELYAFCVGFEGGTPVRAMSGEWLGKLKEPKE